MDIFKILIGVLWSLWLAYWVISGISAKKSVRGRNWMFEIIFRIVIIAAIVIYLRTPILFYWISSIYSSTYANPFMSFLGFIVVIIGLAFSVWARVHLGKNWGMPMTLREKPDLVTTGPYALVRHPIYTGVITAIVGSALVEGIFWWFIIVCVSFYFIYSLNIEEKDMMKQFPKEYKAYKNRTKALIPFVY